HPAWQKREQKLKEATDKAEKSEKEVSKYKEMLRDPVIYRRHLEKEGYSESKVNDLMREAGHPVTSPDHLETKEDIVERMCKQEGWNPKDLDASQNSQIKDLFGAVHRLIKSEMSAGIKSEVAPIKEKFDDVERQAQFSQDYESVKKLAKNEFPEFDFDKEIEPAMISYLDMLDKKDPERTHKIPPEQVYKEATRTLLMDKAKASASKAERAT
ncbi:MAG: hypothetical protein GY836_18115, partial [Herbaspirillum sp.]|uniref:hypothetical protein n=1 Tax=Herbaspirillum sp. TaxID=1890675 RepID=UPI00258A934F